MVATQIWEDLRRLYFAAEIKPRVGHRQGSTCVHVSQTPRQMCRMLIFSSNNHACLFRRNCAHFFSSLFVLV